MDKFIVISPSGLVLYFTDSVLVSSLKCSNVHNSASNTSIHVSARFCRSTYANESLVTSQRETKNDSKMEMGERQINIQDIFVGPNKQFGWFDVFEGTFLFSNH